MKYKVLAAEQDAKGFVDIPEGVTIVSGMFHPVTGKFTIACLEPVVEEPLKEEKPEEETSGKEE